jgi:hypothetical protein
MENHGLCIMLLIQDTLQASSHWGDSFGIHYELPIVHP